jgi:hypothetical protein
MVSDPIAALKRATRAEKAMDKTREQSERDWRDAWWVTTMALAAVPARPQEDLTAATSFVADTLGQSRQYVSMRRSCGRHFFQLELEIRNRLTPRFAIAAAQAKADAETAAELILQAEHEGASLREFSAMLTGKSWTNAPESMTAQERIHVAQTELKQRPHEVLADDAVRESADEASIQIRASRAPRSHPDHVENVTDRFEQGMARNLGIDIPVQHIEAGTKELLMAMFARDIHGTDEAAYERAIAEHEIVVKRVKADKAKHVAWSEKDRELAAEMGLNI